MKAKVKNQLNEHHKWGTYSFEHVQCKDLLVSQKEISNYYPR